MIGGIYFSQILGDSILLGLFSQGHMFEISFTVISGYVVYVLYLKTKTTPFNSRKTFIAYVN